MGSLQCVLFQVRSVSDSNSLTYMCILIPLSLSFFLYIMEIFGPASNSYLWQLTVIMSIKSSEQSRRSGSDLLVTVMYHSFTVSWMPSLITNFLPHLVHFSQRHKGLFVHILKFIYVCVCVCLYTYTEIYKVEGSILSSMPRYTNFCTHIFYDIL